MFLDAFRAAECGPGVACLYGNYAGDNMNVRLAVGQAAAEGIGVQDGRGQGRCALGATAEAEKRRGVAGEILMWKVAGAWRRPGPTSRR